MKTSSRILLAITAAAALSVSRPAFGNVMTHSDNAGNASDLREMLAASPDRMAVITPSFASALEDLLNLGRGVPEDKLLGMRRGPWNEHVRFPVDPPKPGGIPPGVPPGVGVPDGGSTVLLLGLGLLGFAVLRPRLSF